MLECRAVAVFHYSILPTFQFQNNENKFFLFRFNFSNSGLLLCKRKSCSKRRQSKIN